MLNFYQLMTPQGGLFMDVFEGVPSCPQKQWLMDIQKTRPQVTTSFGGLCRGQITTLVISRSEANSVLIYF